MSFATDIQNDVDTILAEVGSSVTITTHSLTTDSMGRVTADSTSTTNITCNIQPVTEKDEKLMAQGWASLGDLKVYAAQGTLSTHKTFTYNSKTYEITKKFKGANMAGTQVFDKFIATLRQ